MTDFPMIARMPGSDSAVATSDFAPGETSGMRTAGWILIATVALTALSWLFTRAGMPPVAVLVDVFLGVQLLRLRHSWRAWTMVRAGIGLMFGTVFLFAGLFGRSGLGGAIIGGSQIAYCGSLFLLLFGTPSMNRVVMGRVVFVVSVMLAFVGGVVQAL